MRPQQEVLNSAVVKMKQQFDISVNCNDTDPKKMLNMMREEVRRIVSHYLAHDINQLLRLLYRVDVNEEDVKLALTKAEPDTELARLIVERELEKAKTRISYRNK